MSGKFHRRIPERNRGKYGEADEAAPEVNLGSTSTGVALSNPPELFNLAWIVRFRESGPPPRRLLRSDALAQSLGLTHIPDQRIRWDRPAGKRSGKLSGKP